MMRSDLILQCHVPTCSRLADDTVIVDLTMTSRDHIVLDIDNVYDRHKREGILIDIPRTNKSRTAIDSKCNEMPSRPQECRGRA